MIEAERKAVVREPVRVRAALEERSGGEGLSEVYRDTYYDTPGRELERDGRELRVRMVRGGGGRRRTVLTYKGSAVDAATGSKPETETVVDDSEAMHGVLRALGYEAVIEFEKRCLNYRFGSGVWELLATLVEVPEVAGSWLEVETMATEERLDEALAVVRDVMLALGVGDGDFTTELYTDAVAAARRG
ncbi:class IV adenylate cyclase [Streptomyces alkaliterrae]|uniref:CYTH domain-containing protein n=1 Tax=Streptomyces alkaliterrae TaxID=2213162 RepID=A0A5P0YSC7_9ACTN|nr:CYTH domain-containing protein [Streptomyces alkaliterrae]MBB1252658.1 CYTH domain-containing protein [Streptomyces alkaliterrae]MBB1257997.1 CYTH domain-containing protein [Streptomyces alkaliterrae]MQS01399.1 CYTH domain-containing protein [Streptomyces alkaliterrae]